jgi:hypothetical protein
VTGKRSVCEAADRKFALSFSRRLGHWFVQLFAALLHVLPARVGCPRELAALRPPRDAADQWPMVQTRQQERDCKRVGIEVRLNDALQHNDRAAVEVLLANHELDTEHLFRSSEAEEVFPNKWRPLHAAAFWGATECIRALLAARATVDSTVDGRNGTFRVTPLVAATLFLQPTVTRLLIESGANIWHEGGGNLQGNKPLTLCMKVMSTSSDNEDLFERGTECARALLDHSGIFSEDAEIRKVARGHIVGDIIHFCAAYVGALDFDPVQHKLCALDRLLSLGVPVDVNINDWNAIEDPASSTWTLLSWLMGYLPQHANDYVLRSQSVPLCACLLRHGADPMRRLNDDGDGEPLVYGAIRAGHLQLVQQLCCYGALSHPPHDSAHARLMAS